jgi:tetratricopeptide (TPR) repeat protein
MQSDLLERSQRLRAYAAQDPTNLALLRDLASTLHAAGEHGQALEVLDRIGETEGASSTVAALRGQVLLALGRWDQAAAVFEAGLLAQPDSAAVAFNLGYALWAAGTSPARAVELFRRAAQIEPANARFHYHLALALEAHDDPQGARRSLHEALVIDPAHAPALAMLGRLALDAGDLDTASTIAERCVRVRPDHAAGWQLKGQVALFRMDAAAAAKSLRQALDMAPDDVDTLVFLAQASLMQGRARHAKALLQQAVDRAPSHDGALCMLGWACVAEDDAASAAAAFERAQAVAPDNADAWAGIACLQLAGGDRDGALRSVRSAQAIEPSHAMVALVESRIAELDGRTADAQAIADRWLKSAPGMPLGASFEQTLANAAASPAVRRMQRRFARAGAVSSNTRATP